jgi:hypothetical protein
VTKGSLRGPGYTNWDGAIIRSFPVIGDTNLEFRAEYFNVLNHTKLGNPNTTESNSAFGTITATNPSSDSQRIAQFSLKYTF